MNQIVMTRNVAEAVLNPPEAPAVTGGDVLRVLGLVKTYRTGFWRRPHPALKGVSFVVRRGEVFALLGHNGAGKTTTMKCILDLVHPDAGDIEIFGTDYRRWQSRARIGYLPEGPYFYDHLTGRELLDFYARLFGMTQADRQQQIAELLAQVGMADHADTRLGKYSKGMLQRIGLAQALLNRPELLILDEPMTGLDPLGRREVRDLLTVLKRGGTTILLSTHIVPDVEALADRVAILRSGFLHSVHDLNAGGGGRHFEVALNREPHGTIADVVWDCNWVPDGPGRSGGVVQVPDLERLHRLLSWCSDLGTEVRSVRTRQTSLEEIFLAALNADTGQEVQERC